MRSTTRRALLGSVCALAGIAGCLGDPSGSESPASPASPSETRTRTPIQTVSENSCSASTPPAPTDAAADPKPYPGKPSGLTHESVGSFVEAYERAYQYNDMLAEHPDKIGRLNDLDISVSEVAVTVDDGRFAADVSGQANTGITADVDDAATPTRTPLPMGHWPFETSYTVTEQFVRRAGIVHECW